MACQAATSASRFGRREGLQEGRSIGQLTVTVDRLLPLARTVTPPPGLGVEEVLTPPLKE
jgi:hypothetical protein